MLDQGCCIGCHAGHRVGSRRRLGPPAASVVEGDDGMPGCGQVGYLGEPQVGRLAGAADEQDRRAIAGR